MSQVELLEAQGSAWSYALVAVFFVVLVLGVGWYSVHGGPLVLKIWRRGTAYRASLRAARHAAPSRPLLPRQRLRS